VGLLLLGTAAGAPFLPKLAQIAKGNLAFAVGLMVLLMVVTEARMSR
jgi:BASS family bile acid:Na+ symporter